MKSTDYAVIVMVAALVYTWFQPAASTATHSSGPAVDGSRRLGQWEESYRAIAQGVVAAVRPSRGDVSCASDAQWLTCHDIRGRTVQSPNRVKSPVWDKFWRSRTTNNGYVVYQPKDVGRVFFAQRTPGGQLYWIVYDPQGRELPGWLRAQGFTDVGSYNENFAWAGRIVDQQKRHDFWIWVQARQRRIAEFETKYPHLAAPELSKTPR